MTVGFREMNRFRIATFSTFAQLKDIAKTSGDHRARFAIAHDGRMVSADALHFVHDQMLDPTLQHTVGMVKHNPNDNTFMYRAWPSYHNSNKEELHPLTSKFEKFGMVLNNSLNSRN